MKDSYNIHELSMLLNLCIMDIIEDLTETPSHVIDVIHPRNLYMDHLESGMDITNTNILNVSNYT